MLGKASIRTKLYVVLLATSGLALLLAGGGLLAWDYVGFRKVLDRRIRTLGSIVAGQSTAAVAFDDPKAAEEILAGLAGDENVAYAAIFRREGGVLARYHRADLVPADIAPARDGLRYEAGALIHACAISSGGERIGTLQLRYDLASARARFRRNLIFAVGILLAAEGAALWIGWRLGARITAPILRLAETARAETRERDREPAPSEGGDEIEVLAGSFRGMIEAVRDRDAALEGRVASRTRELRLAQERILRQQEALVAAAGSALSTDDLDAALRILTEMDAKTLGVERVSVWRFTPDRAAIRAADLYEASRDAHSSGAELPCAPYPSYFQAVGERNVVAADDARTDPRTREFAESYLDPLGITSMMDAPLHFRGALQGILCHEHVGPARSWTPDERTFAVAMANLASLALAQAERRAAEESLRFQKAMLEAQSEAGPDGILVVSAEGRMISFNRRFVELWGLPADVIESRSDEAALASVLSKLEDPEGFLARVRHLYGHPDEESRDEIRLRDGRILDRYSAPVRGAEGASYGRVWFFTDVTHRRRAEEEIRRSKEDLESFSYSVSHDLRAPLRSINGFSQALLEDYADRLDDEGREHLNRVRAATRRMELLIDDLLELARVGRTEMRPEDVDLSAMAETILAHLRLQDPKRDVEAVIQPGLRARGDPILLRSALENLIENAWKFTGRHARARIEFGREGEAFFVRDDGAGFNPEFRSQLFHPFQRLHRETEFPGTGIGLATVHRIVTRHGGKVWAEGAVEKGATFYFTLGGEA